MLGDAVSSQKTPRFLAFGVMNFPEKGQKRESCGKKQERVGIVGQASSGTRRLFRLIRPANSRNRTGLLWLLERTGK